VHDLPVGIDQPSDAGIPGGIQRVAGLHSGAVLDGHPALRATGQAPQIGGQRIGCLRLMPFGHTRAIGIVNDRVRPHLRQRDDDAGGDRQKDHRDIMQRSSKEIGQLHVRPG